MIDYRTGDILKDESEALVNTVNCVGVMGRGIALQFKDAYPDNFKHYTVACKRGDVKPGEMLVYETNHLTGTRYIINFPTKRHWRGKSRIQDIESGLNALTKVLLERQIRSVAIPPLGSGLGGLNWRDVRPLIERTMRALPDIRVTVYEPNGTPTTETMSHSRNVPKMTAGRAALVELINRYLAGLLDPQVSLLEVHKLMYFLQESGEPLRLQFKAAPYGPYAENLRHVLHAVEGHLISGYADGGDAPGKQLLLVPGAIEDAAAFLGAHHDTKCRFNRVSELVEGFESPFGLELLSTIHWLIKKNNVSTLSELVDQTYAWNERKRKFTKRQISIAADVLATKGWAKAIQPL